MQKNIDFARANRDRYIRELKEFLAIPSISSDPAEKDSMQRCAEHAAALLRAAGCEDAAVRPTDGHPVVTGSITVNPNLPTILVYGHYDVQPVDPLELWDNPPFEAIVKGDYIIARGAADDKGLVYIHIKAVEAFLKTGGKMPLNVKFIIEGEEEIGSPSLTAFMEANRNLLAADAVIISDTAMWEGETPAITYGLKGLAYLEFELTGPNRDLHSGEYGGGIANPAEIIARMLTQVKDEDGRILIPGFYDKVKPLTQLERDQLALIPYDEKEYMNDLGVDALWGEKGYTQLERVWCRPTFEVNGIWGGFTGSGSKTVLPAKASAKISMRLVPDQTPDEIAEKVMSFLNSITPPTMKIKWRRHSGGMPFLTSLDSPLIKAGTQALREAFHREPLMIRAGGSIPIVVEMKRILGSDILLVGYALPSCRAHSPNENQHLPSLFTGIESQIRMMGLLAEALVRR